MKSGLSVVMVTKNSDVLLDQSLSSVDDLADEIIVVDGHSTDRTVKISKDHNANIFQFRTEDQGLKKGFGVDQAGYEWIMILDSDEIVGSALKFEIKEILKSNSANSAYLIPYNNHFLSRPVRFGGEDYIILRLFKKTAAVIRPSVTHEKVEIKSGKTGVLKNRINHYSYRSFSQILRKFTYYAVEDARRKLNSGEKTGLKKIILYPLHMFYSRFVEDKGYKDGLFRIPLDLGFAYMEFLTYFLMLFKRKNRN